jgi:hypothetical protein
VNVCWSLDDPATLRREVESLEWGRKRYPEAEVLLVAHQEGNHPPASRGEFATVTAWQYLMGESTPVAVEREEPRS